MRIKLYISALAIAFLSFKCAAAEETYFQQYLRIVDFRQWPTGHFTSLKSPFLVDTNNTTGKLKNSVIPVNNLKTNGEIAGIRLGMTTDEVVARWGKPRSIACSSPIGPWFGFSDVTLHFKTNSLDRIQFRETTRFDHGLRGDSPLDDWVRVLGEPTERTNGEFRSILVYETRGMMHIVLVLRFDPDGEMTTTIYRDPEWLKAAKP